MIVLVANRLPISENSNTDPLTPSLYLPFKTERWSQFMFIKPISDFTYCANENFNLFFQILSELSSRTAFQFWGNSVPTLRKPVPCQENMDQASHFKEDRQINLPSKRARVSPQSRTSESNHSRDDQQSPLTDAEDDQQSETQSQLLSGTAHSDACPMFGHRSSQLTSNVNGSSLNSKCHLGMTSNSCDYENCSEANKLDTSELTTGAYNVSWPRKWFTILTLIHECTIAGTRCKNEGYVWPVTMRPNENHI